MSSDRRRSALSSPIVTGRNEVEGRPLFVEEQRFLSRPLSLALLLGCVAFAVWALIFLGTLRAPEWVPLAVGTGLMLPFHLLS